MLNSLFEIEQFLFNYFEKKGVYINELNKSYRFLDSGIIDSISIINFIVELEMSFEIKFETEEIHSEQFVTIGSLALLIYSKIKTTQKG